MTDLIRILIADDHYVVRQGLATLLAPRNGMEVVGEAATGREAVELARTLQPDVILMDMIMPEMTGPEAISLIKQENPNARILVLTSFGESKQVSAAIQAGALGYLLKDSSPDDLLHAIRSVYRGNLVLPQDLAVKLMQPQPSCGRPRSTDRAGNRCVAAAGPGAIEPGDRQEPEHQRHHRAFACKHDPDEAGCLQPNASCFGCPGAPTGVTRTIMACSRLNLIARQTATLPMTSYKCRGSFVSRKSAFIPMRGRI